MTNPSIYVRRLVARPRRWGLTLIELIVTLVLSVLVLSMVLPLITSLLKPQPALAGVAFVSPSWQRSLQADLQELVSPSKCGVPTFQILPPSEKQPYAELILQTFCRASGVDISAQTRGPSEIRYSLETDGSDGPLVLVRYAKGWHDPTANRFVLATHLSSWSLAFDGVAASVSQSDPTTPSIPPPDVRPGKLGISLVSLTGAQEASLWVPLLSAKTPTLKPDDGSDDHAKTGDNSETESPMENVP